MERGWGPKFVFVRLVGEGANITFVVAVRWVGGWVAVEDLRIWIWICRVAVVVVVDGESGLGLSQA
jgi:hypothetical protein